MKSKTTQSNKKTIMICSVTAIVLLVLVFLWFFIPFLKASIRLNEIKRALNEHEYLKIVVGQANAYTSGSLEQITQDFEHILTDEEKAEFVSYFLSSSQNGFPEGSSVQKGGFWDIKITLITEEDRIICYLDEQYIYVTDGNTRFNFICTDRALFNFIQKLKRSQA